MYCMRSLRSCAATRLGHYDDVRNPAMWTAAARYLSRRGPEPSPKAPPPSRSICARKTRAGGGAARCGTDRQLFEAKLHSLSEDARAALASTAGEPELSALCFDPTPRVVRAVLENPRAGLPHARLIAAHHGNAAGLEA